MFQTENFKLVQSLEKEHFPTSGCIKMQRNCVRVRFFSSRLGLTKFPWKMEATKAAGGCYPAEY